MGAGYGGTGASLTYQESANFTFNAIGAPFLVYLFNDASLGNGFDSAEFQIILNGIVVDSQSFTDLASAQAFFSADLIDIALAAGPDDVQLVFDETMGSSSNQGFSFDYAVAATSATPLPPGWTMMLAGLAGVGLLSYRRKKLRSAASIFPLS